MNEPSRRQPVFNIPGVLLTILAVLALIHIYRSALSDEADAALLRVFAFVPARLSISWDPVGVATRLAALAGNADTASRFEMGRYLLGDGSAQPWCLLTYAFLHGDWTHLGLNAIWLLAFGAPLARRFGPARFLVFLAFGAVAGSLTHYALFRFDFEPLIGASASVSACMGAALRFMFRPAAPTSDGEPALFAAVDRRPSLTVLQALRDRRSLAFLVVWFATNLVTGIGAVGLGLTSMPIAWQAHIGGFLFGLLAFRLFDPVAKLAAPLQPEAAADADRL